MNTFNINCRVAVKDPTDVPLTVTTVLNGEEQKTYTITDNTSISVEVPDIDDNTYQIDYVISGKTDDHTTINESGAVLSSTELVFSKFNIDHVDIDHIVQGFGLPYTHTHNGSTEETTGMLYDTAGFNGTIRLEITTPYYTWLLEKI